MVDGAKNCQMKYNKDLDLRLPEFHFGNTGKSASDKFSIFSEAYAHIEAKNDKLLDGIRALPTLDIAEANKKAVEESIAKANKSSSAEKSAKVASIVSQLGNVLGTLASTKALSSAQKAAGNITPSAQKTDYTKLSDSDLASEITKAKSEYEAFNKIKTDAETAKNNALDLKRQKVQDYDKQLEEENNQNKEYVKQNDIYNAKDKEYVEQKKFAEDAYNAIKGPNGLEKQLANAIQEQNQLDKKATDYQTKFQKCNNKIAEIKNKIKAKQEEQQKAERARDEALKARDEALNARNNAEKAREDAKAAKIKANELAVKAEGDAAAQQKTITNNKPSLDAAKTKLDNLEAEQRQRANRS